MRFLMFFLVFLCVENFMYAQDFSLIHSGTLYDSFENPVQSAYTKDQSRTFALSILPSIGGDFWVNGDAEKSAKSYLSGVALKNPFVTNNNFSNVKANVNVYIFQFKIHKAVQYDQELGFALQFRNEGYLDASNNNLAFFFNNTELQNGNYPSIFNSKARNMAYWQLSLTYRENYNKTWAFGGKISLLSGITYHKLRIYNTNLMLSDDFIETDFSGKIISSTDLESPTTDNLKPNLKNPGISTSLGTSYTSKSGYYLSFNLKDLGFIKWNKSATTYTADGQHLKVTNDESKDIVIDNFGDDLAKSLKTNKTNKSIFASLNSAVNFAVSKHFGAYQPVAVLNADIYNQNTYLALIHNYTYKVLNFGISTDYNLDKGFNLGANFRIKSPNAEFYLGSEKLFPTYSNSKTFIKNDGDYGNNSAQFNLFLGLNIKFGKRKQSIGNADFIDGLNDKETGFIYRLNNREKRATKRQKGAVSKRRKSNDKRNN